MRLRADQLTGQIQQSLAPVYLIYGDEQMLVEENSDLVRQAARKLGADDRQVWHVEGRFDWSQIQWQEQTMSLFASQRLLEVRLPSGSPGKEGGEALRNYCLNTPADTTLLIISGKIDTRSQKSKWFTELDKFGVTLPIWPVDVASLPGWIAQRMKQRGLHAHKTITTLIAERVEGNLYAAAQEIDKLSLLCPDGNVDEQTVLNSVADNARFQAFGLMDMAYAGQIDKIPRVVEGLRAEGLEFLSVFSAVSWSLHRMVDMAKQIESGQQAEQVFRNQKPQVWQKSWPIVKQALTTHTRLQWQLFLGEMARIDQAAKGANTNCPWSLLEALCLRVAGMKMNLHY